MLKTDKWRPSTSQRLYYPTEKEPDPGDNKGYAYWTLAGQIGEKLGEGGATLEEIYEKVTSPLGLSLNDTRTLVQNAKVEGYLK